MLDVYPEMMRRALDACEALPPDRAATVRFEDLAVRPMETLRAIYDRLSLPDFDLARPKIDAYLHSIRSYRVDTHALPTSIVERIADRWQPIFQRLDYPTDPRTRTPHGGRRAPLTSAARHLSGC